MIYLDNAATSFTKPLQVKNAVNVAMNLYTANAGRGAHTLSQLSAEKIYDTRQKLLKFFNAKNHKVIFTSGCSSALNFAILGSVKQGGHIITTSLEHNSVLRPLQYLKDIGVIDYTVIDNYTISELNKAVRANTYMVITTQASNVTGEHLDILNINKWCRKNGFLHLVDTAQGAGHIFEDLSEIDMIAFAGHKGLFGLGGVGGLVVKEGIELKPILFGGTGTFSESLMQPTAIPEGFEVGTVANIPIISLGAGIDYVIHNKQYILSKEERLNKQLSSMLNSLNFVTPYFSKDSVGVYSFNVCDYDSSFVSDFLNEKYAICTRSGLHCAPLVHKKLSTLDRGAVRVSVNCDNSEYDIEILQSALKQLYSINNKK